MNCYGSGLQPNGVIQGKPAEFVVDTKKAGVAPLDVKVTSEWPVLTFYVLKIMYTWCVAMMFS